MKIRHPYILLLNLLGDDADKIAESLEKRGCKGVRKSASCCPLAMYLKAATKEDDIEIGGDYIEVDSCTEGEEGSSERVTACDLPEPFAKFVGNFDACKYPNLIQE